MPRKGSPAASGSGHANIRAFFTASTPLREVTNNIPANSAAPAAHAATAAANPESNQIRTAGGSARASLGGSARSVQRQSLRAEEEGEDVDYSGSPALCFLCACLCTADHAFMQETKKKSTRKRALQTTILSTTLKFRTNQASATSS